MKKVTPEMLRLAFVAMHGIPAEVYDSMPDPVREAAAESVREAVEKAMGDDGFFDENVLFRMKLAKVTAQLTELICTVLPHCGLTQEEYREPMTEAVVLAFKGLGVTDGSLEEKIEAATGFLRMIDGWPTTARHIVTLMFCDQYIEALAEPERWEHQTDPSVESLMREVLDDET